MAAESTRRAMLAATLAGVTGSLSLAGCKGITALGPVPAIGPAVVTLEHAIESEEALVAMYRTAAHSIARVSTAAAVITAISAEHQAHLAQLRARLIVPPGHARIRLRAKPARPPSLPADPRQLLATLAAAERAAAARLTGQLLDAPAPLAQLLASISASEAAHVVFLREGESA